MRLIAEKSLVIPQPVVENGEPVMHEIKYGGIVRKVPFTENVFVEARKVFEVSDEFGAELVEKKLAREIEPDLDDDAEEVTDLTDPKEIGEPKPKATRKRKAKAEDDV